MRKLSEGRIELLRASDKSDVFRKRSDGPGPNVRASATDPAQYIVDRVFDVPFVRNLHTSAFRRLVLRDTAQMFVHVFARRETVKSFKLFSALFYYVPWALVVAREQSSTHDKIRARREGFDHVAGTDATAVLQL